MVRREWGIIKADDAREMSLHDCIFHGKSARLAQASISTL